MDESGAENLQPLTETLDQDVFLAARILLAQQYRDQQTRLIDCPISFLQRNLRVSYRKAYRLADALEKIGDWSLAENNSRTIYYNFVT
jgi:phosphate uptake regulator